MAEDYIKFDFARGTIEVQNQGEHGTITMPDLAEKRAEIYSAAGLEQIPVDELRADINSLFKQLGLDLNA